MSKKTVKNKVYAQTNALGGCASTINFKNMLTVAS